tara:strand:- start:632 stop:793 length:162 start_codon:yes stop_codon:yes gene_type:complete
MILIEKVCGQCKNIRKFVKYSPRDRENTCGECWDWEARPPLPLDSVGGTVGKV